MTRTIMRSMPARHTRPDMRAMTTLPATATGMATGRAIATGTQPAATTVACSRQP